MFYERQPVTKKKITQFYSRGQKKQGDYNGYSTPGEAYANRPIPGKNLEYKEILQRKRQDPNNQKSFYSARVTEEGSNNQPIIQEKGQDIPNKIGLPDQLKIGVENLSGYSLDNVRVHYNSPKPAQLQALAYTQGTDIHVAPGQEQHLPHEAWHVVQQMQGRVKPTMQMKGVQINDDEALEREADVMGEKIICFKSKTKDAFVKQKKKGSNEVAQLGKKEGKGNVGGGRKQGKKGQRDKKYDFTGGIPGDQRSRKQLNNALFDLYAHTLGKGSHGDVTAKNKDDVQSYIFSSDRALDLVRQHIIAWLELIYQKNPDKFEETVKWAIREAGGWAELIQQLLQQFLSDLPSDDEFSLSESDSDDSDNEPPPMGLSQAIEVPSR